MIRCRLCKVAAIMSLLIGMAIAALWCRSYATDDWYFERYISDTDKPTIRELEIHSARGGLSLAVEKWSPHVPDSIRELKFDGRWWHDPRPEVYAGKEGPHDFYDPTPTMLNKLGLYCKWYVAEVGKNGIRSIIVREAFEVDWDRWIEIAVPYWLPVLATLIMPAIAGFQLLPRRKRGHCRTCGYNLTGNASGVCPECGTAVPTKSTAVV